MALVAFAANSVLCRLALGGSKIDPAGFTSIRLVSGALMLLLISAAIKRSLPKTGRSNLMPAALLFLYAISFSLAYTSLSAGTGALILFGSVQVTMIAAALRSGERPHALEWLGLIIALGGLFYLASPGLSAPPLIGSALMAAAGISWGFYSLRGRASTDPLASTTGNFLLAAPLALAVNLFTLDELHLSTPGIALAVASGAVASGVGYVIWYAALRGLTATRAATVQLAVPVLAALGGVIFLAESLSLRLALAAVFIIGGVALALAGRLYSLRAKAEVSSTRL
jgi:drug/metabolite transporter (DMT)-like permease